ncbi:hypothetical protein TNCV_2258391 [Trichonephila clavipes]|nr:hypothetical protein TNCV_2258391 [Trichonephila clavipes]
MAKMIAKMMPPGLSIIYDFTCLHVSPRSTGVGTSDVVKKLPAYLLTTFLGEISSSQISRMSTLWRLSLSFDRQLSNSSIRQMNRF